MKGTVGHRGVRGDVWRLGARRRKPMSVKNMAWLLGAVCALGVLFAWRWGGGSPVESFPAASRPEAGRETATADKPATGNERQTANEQADRHVWQPSGAAGNKVRIRVVEAGRRTAVSGATVTGYDLDLVTKRLADQHVGYHTSTGRSLRLSLSVRATTNSDGTCYLSATGLQPVVEARLGDQWGIKYLAESDGPDVEVEIAPDSAFRLRVHYADGRPAIGVPVALVQHVSGSTRFSGQITETEEPSGVAVFEHVQRRLAQGAGWQATFGFPVVNQPSVAFSADTNFDQVPTLVLSGAGRMEILVRDGKGAAPSIPLHVAVRASSPDVPDDELCPNLPWSTPAVGVGGLAVVPWLGVGLNLRVSVEPSEQGASVRPVTSMCKGPAQDGERVSCEVVWSETTSYPIAVGRLVRADGSAWAPGEVSFLARLVPEAVEGADSGTLEVGDGGRFELVVKHTWMVGTQRAYRLFSLDRSPGQYIQTTLDLSRDLLPGENDVGDVIMDAGAPLASGNVVDERGNPLGGVTIKVIECLSKSGTESTRMLACTGTWKTKEDGRFERYCLWGEAIPTRRLLLAAEARGFVQYQPTEFLPGASNLRVELVRAGAIAGTVRLDERRSADAFAIIISGSGLYQAVKVRPDGSFHQGDLPPANYQLTARVQNLVGDAEGTQVSFKDLRVVPGETNRDPRIQGIAVPADFKEIALTIVDEGSAPLSNANARVRGSGQRKPFFADDSGRIVVRCTALPVDVTVTAVGYRDSEMHDLASDHLIVLRRGILVRFVTSVQTCGRDPTYQLGLRVCYGSGSRDEGRPVDAYSLREDLVWFGSDGVLERRLPGPGEYRLTPILRVVSDGNPIIADLPIVPEPTVTLREEKQAQWVSIDVPRDLVTKTVSHLAGR